MPLSLMSISTASGTARTFTTIEPPRSVNLSALPSRFVITTSSFSLSPKAMSAAVRRAAQAKGQFHALCRGLECPDDIAQKMGQIQVGDAAAAAARFQPRQIEQTVDQPMQPQTVAQHHLQCIAMDVGQTRTR